MKQDNYFSTNGFGFGATGAPLVAGDGAELGAAGALEGQKGKIQKTK